MEESTFYSERAKLKIRRNFFTVRAIKQWNCLPSEVLGTPSLKVFKKMLDSHLSGMVWRFLTRELELEDLQPTFQWGIIWFLEKATTWDNLFNLYLFSLDPEGMITKWATLRLLLSLPIILYLVHLDYIALKRQYPFQSAWPNHWKQSAL